jgi:hypothetical protein
MRWVGHVACMGKMRNANKVIVRKPEGKNHSENSGIDGNIRMDIK